MILKVMRKLKKVCIQSMRFPLIMYTMRIWSIVMMSLKNKKQKKVKYIIKIKRLMK